MAFVIADRVKETTTTGGTGTVTLAGAVAGFQSFSAIGNGNSTYYTITDATNGTWEVGIGIYTSSGTTLSRDTVLASSNSGSLVSFATVSKDVFVTYPSQVAIYSSNNAGTTGQLLKSNGTGIAPSWQDYLTYLPVLTRTGSTTNVTITNGYLPVLTRGGSTTSVPVY